MTYEVITFAYTVRIHTRNGYADITGFGVIEKSDGKPLSEDTVVALSNLGLILKNIVVTNGYVIEQGKLIKSETLPQKELCKQKL